MSLSVKIRHDEERVNSANVGERRLLVAILHRALIDLLEIGNEKIEGKKIDLHVEENLYTFMETLREKRVKIGEKAAGPDQRKLIQWFQNDEEKEFMSFAYILRALSLEPIREKVVKLI